MNDIFHDMLDVCVKIYLDDILIYSKDKSKHPEHVREVLRRLREHGLFLNLSKCHFHKEKIDYLGLVISKGNVQVDQEKITAVLNWSTPKNVKNIQEFLGFVNFYRRFIPSFSNVAKPLYNLTKKDSPWNWGEKEENAFQTIRQLLKEAPVLLQSNVKKPFYLECDA